MKKNHQNTDCESQNTQLAHKTRREIEADKAFAESMTANDKNLPKFGKNENGAVELKVPDVAKYSQMFGGSQSLDFLNAMAHSCANVSGQNESHKDDKNHALAIVAEVAPQDGIEALLATQMSAVHLAIVRHSRLMASADMIQQLEIHERVFNKLTRTFTAQVEALRKHRHGGEQKMTVEHVTVEKGGQAIVGNVGKGGVSESARQPLARPISCTSLHCTFETHRLALQSPCSSRLDCLPYARSERWRSKGRAQWQLSARCQYPRTCG